MDNKSGSQVDSKIVAITIAIPIAFFVAVWGLARSGSPNKEISLTKNSGAAQPQVESAEEVTAKKKRDLSIRMSNRVQSECLQFARKQVVDPSSMEVKQGWVNGEIESDFVALQPFSSKNAFGVRISGTAVCTGNNGVISEYQLDMR
jgi:hypothetical protein